MKTLPEHITAYNKSPTFTEQTVPAALLRNHKTKQGVWGLIIVLDGELQFDLPDEGTMISLNPERPGIVEPEQKHSVKPLGTVRFYIEFYR